MRAIISEVSLTVSTRTNDDDENNDQDDDDIRV